MARKSNNGQAPSVKPDVHQTLENEIERAGGARPAREKDDALGVTMFDVPGSTDNTITVLLGRANVQHAAAQSLVRIHSEADDRRYLGVVTAGPFAEPDSLRGDSSILVTVATRGGDYLPPYHGRVEVSILHEELQDGTLVTPRLRPLPHSPVYRLTDEESAAILKSEGDLRLGLVEGHESLPVHVPTNLKSVLPRHLAVLGTTGAGKSTTIANLVQQAQAAGMAVILLDVEGEYVHLHEPTDNVQMKRGREERGLEVKGIPPENMTLYHLVGRDTANPDHPNRREFSLQFAHLSPYVAMEIMGLSEAQQERFLKAYDITKQVMRDLGIFPEKGKADQEQLAMDVDEFERGYPRLTLSLLIDVVQACLAKVEKPSSKGKSKDSCEEAPSTWEPFNESLASTEGKKRLQIRVNGTSMPGSAVSWIALLGRLHRLNRLKVFYNGRGIKPLKYSELLQPGKVSVIDLSDCGATEMSNVVIADLLRGLQEAQDEAYHSYEKNQTTEPPSRALLIIEEAHEFLSVERIDKMKILFEQVARIAKRGRKRWLGLAFVTQLPQHLPRQVLGLVNSHVLHKITDPLVISSLKKTVSGIDEGLWNRLPGLAPGQAIVSFPHLTRPLLVSMDPSPAQLRLVD